MAGLTHRSAIGTAEADACALAFWLPIEVARQERAERQAAEERNPLLAGYRGTEEGHGAPEAADGGGCISGARVADYRMPSFAIRRMAAGLNERKYRRAVMSAARSAEEARREALTRMAADEPQAAAWCPPDASEWSGVPLRTLTLLASEGWRSAETILGAFERRLRDVESERRETLALMAAEPNGGGRGTAPLAVHPDSRKVSRAEGVNGTEVRAGERWRGTPRAAVTLADGTAIDWQCYRIVPPASGIGPEWREPFTPPPSEEEERVRRIVAADERVALLTLAGTLGAAAQGA